MWSIFKKREPIKAEEPVDPRPPIGAMFKDEDSEGRYLIVTKHLEVTREDYRDSMTVEFFPAHSRSAMKMSMSYLNDKYKRMSPEQEKKWQQEYFADKEAYFVKESETQYNENLKRQEALVARHEDYYKQQAKPLEKKIDTTKEKFLVIHSSSCTVFESLLNRASKKRFKVILTNQTTQGWFMAVLARK